MMQYVPVPVGTLVTKAKDKILQETTEPIYGGYSNARGDIALFGDSFAYRVNLKNKTIRQQPWLNPQAQVRYDAAESGETFQYCSAQFCRLSDPQILEICASGPFRVMPRFI
jgi:hypothetical protein